MKLRKKVFCFVLILFLLVPLSFAHEADESAEENILLQFAMPIWDFHDSVHWVIAIFFFGTCYYFRYFYARTRNHPKICGLDEKSMKKNRGDLVINRFHRYFFWLMLIFILIHLSEAATKATGTIEYKFSLFNPYIFPFTSEYEGPVTDIQFLGTITEWLYVIILLTFLFSCYFARYFLGKCFGCSQGIKRKIYLKQNKLNTFHGQLFWLSIIISVTLLLLGGHL